MASQIGHSIITKAAFETLPEWARIIWKEDKEKLIEEYCLYPDWFHPTRPRELEKYMFFYQSKKREFHYMPAETIKENRERCMAGFKFFLEKIAHNIKENQSTEAAKYAGVIAHFFEDAAGCQHSLEGPMGFNIPFGVPYPLVMQLFPPPEDKKYAPAQQTVLSQMQEPKIAIAGYKPRFLGTSLVEASFHLYERYWSTLRTSRGNVAGVINAFYRSDKKKMNNALRIMLKEGARVIADLFYTAVSLGKGRFEPEDLEKLREVPLENLTPLYRPWYTPMPIYSHNCLIRNFNLNEKLKPVPLTVLMKKNGKTAPVTFKNGIGTGGGWNFKKDSGINYKIGYSIPANIFSKFKVVPGLNCLLENKGKVKLQIYWNGKVVYDTEVISGKEPAHEALIDVSKGGVLELVFKRIGSGYPEIHVVWGNPVLSRSKKATIWK